MFKRGVYARALCQLASLAQQVVGLEVGTMPQYVQDICLLNVGYKHLPNWVSRY